MVKSSNLSSLSKAVFSARQEVDRTHDCFQKAKVAQDQAIADYEEKLAKYLAMSAENLPAMSENGTDSVLDLDPFPDMNIFVKSLMWAGNLPSGAWFNPLNMDYRAMSASRDENEGGGYTLNGETRVWGLSGKEQTARLRAILPDQIGIEEIAKNATRVDFVELAIAQGYILPDLRAMKYIFENQAEARCLNPKLFEDLLTASSMHGGYEWAFFLGSTIRSGDGIVCFPCLNFNGTSLNPNGHYLCNSWSPEGDVLLVIERC